MSLTRRAGIEMPNLPDCGGLAENGGCRWLKAPRCLGAACAYAGRSNSQERSYRRLRELPESEQSRISEKYYGGSRPWRAGPEKGEKN